MTATHGGWVCVCGTRADGPINAPGPRRDHQETCRAWNHHRAMALTVELNKLDRDEAREWGGPWPELRRRWTDTLRLHVARLDPDAASREQVPDDQLRLVAQAMVDIARYTSRRKGSAR